MRGWRGAVASGRERAPGRRCQDWCWVARIALLCVAFPLGMAACGGAASPTTAAVSTSTTMPPTATSAAAGPPTATAGAVATATRAATGTRGVTNYPPVVRLALEALARDLGLSPDQIIVAELTEREWPSSALGCPEPGRTYLQVVTPGYRVIFVAQGKNYEYHTNHKSMYVRCPS